MIYNQILSWLKEYLDKPSEYRSFVLYSSDWNKKRKICEKIAEEMKGTYVDFLKDKMKALNPEVGLYSPSDLKRDIEKWAKEANTILVMDEIDALFDTWKKKNQQDFFKIISSWRPESVVLISTIIDLDYEELLSGNRVFRIPIGGT